MENIKDAKFNESSLKSQTQMMTFLIIHISANILFFYLVFPFVGVVLWSIVTVIIFSPFYQVLLKAFGAKRKNLAAVLTLIVSSACFTLPFVTTVGLAIFEAKEFLKNISMKDGGYSLQKLLFFEKYIPQIDRTLNKLGLSNIDIEAQLVSGVERLAQNLAEKSFYFGQGSLQLFLSLGIVIFISFFLFRDGDDIMKSLLKYFPLGRQRENALLSSLSRMITATLRGGIAVGVVQGLLGGVAFLIVNVEGAILWSVLMIFASFIPVVGAALIWLPISFYFFIVGQVWSGVFLILYGSIVVGLVDNILRPRIVGASTGVPDYLVLITTLGGISIFGFNGFILGPVAGALFLAVWKQFHRDFQS